VKVQREPVTVIGERTIECHRQERGEIRKGREGVASEDPEARRPAWDMQGRPLPRPEWAGKPWSIMAGLFLCGW